MFDPVLSVMFVDGHGHKAMFHMLQSNNSALAYDVHMTPSIGCTLGFLDGVSVVHRLVTNGNCVLMLSVTSGENVGRTVSVRLFQ